MSSLREALVRTVYQVGWRVGSRVPAPVQRVIMNAGARLATWQNGPHLRQLRHNLTVAAGAPATDALVRDAVSSYLRNLIEMLALPGWGPAEIRRRVTTSAEQPLRTAYQTQGAVVALPHSGNWDLAGAWACLTGMPVTTVAERLADSEFNAFTNFRRRLGMEVLANTDPAVIAKLGSAINDGRLVCLVADRDLTGSGVPVRWGDTMITMPAGPAMVARRTGAALVPAVCQFTTAGMKIIFGPPVQPRPGRTGLVEMTQQVADFFAARIAERPADWHMMQPFFERRRVEPRKPHTHDGARGVASTGEGTVAP
ncbi:phosphatidylinositol mannoside acyltransferase [Microlunatus panaciterrae]|uniref:KDO2-lipid IV(A) lauroyltransferase n=1 Tax=Microlunatus panaciterrae TaxID=400768 RepID=A0ABS2RDM3_9ACTN|nr:phosphatidylinositol mannoside acyltransferase [Microlunatus panaciterrae]MBM7797100.1 KDO2-lipid IV(A) lauroyltransferase [Microlunatus panaciterrae]